MAIGDQADRFPLRFSALQRAENSSLHILRRRRAEYGAFQCSSASRKFLNSALSERLRCVQVCFSALQRAENSSIADYAAMEQRIAGFSALQRAENSSIVVVAHHK